MADRPPSPAVSPEARIRERAYHLWEAAGKPHGHDVEFWQRARELIALEDGADATSPSRAAPAAPGKRAANSARSRRKPPATKAP